MGPEYPSIQKNESKKLAACEQLNKAEYPSIQKKELERYATCEQFNKALDLTNLIKGATR